jgi:hypothetical protein
MIGYIEHLRRRATIGASSIAGYVSGFLRFSLPMFPLAYVYFSPLIFGVNSFFTRLGIATPGFSDIVSCSLPSKALRRAISGGLSG